MQCAAAGRLSQQLCLHCSARSSSTKACCCCKHRIYSFFFPSPPLSCRRFTIGKKGMIVFHERAIRERGGCNCKQLRWITKSDNKGRPHANYPFVTNKPNKRGQNNRRRRRGDKEGRQKKVAFMDGREGAEAKLEALEILINFFLRVDRKINVLGGVMVP